MKKINLFLIFILTLFSINSFGQGTDCATADPFCSGITYNFPLQTNNGSAEVGPDYTCLYTQPNPVWYYLYIDQPGQIDIHIQSSPGQFDVDFSLWGPFTSLNNCGNLTASNTVDCSYSSSYQEDANIPNAQSGQYYILLITNYSNATTDVVFSQTNSGPGAGSASCNPVICNFDNITYTVNPCNPQTNQYCVSGTILYHFTSPWTISTGTLVITDYSSGVFQTFYPPFNSPTAYNLCGILSDGLQHTLIAYFSDAPTCTDTVTYTAPGPCNACVANAGSNITICGLTATLNAIESTGDVNTHWIAQSGVTFSGTGINSPTATITVTTAGTYNLVWQVTNSSGLTCYDTTAVTFQAIPTSLFTVTSPICAGQTSTMTYTGTGGSQFNWSFGNGTPSTAVTIGPHVVTYSTSGSQTVSLFVTGANGCFSDTTTQTVVVNPVPSSAFTAQSPICINSSSVVQAPCNANYSYQWNWGSGTAIPGTGCGPHSVTWSSIGAQSIYLTVTDVVTGCVSTPTLQQVQVLDSTTLNCCITPNPNAGVDDNICGLTYTLNASLPSPGNVGSWSQVSGPGSSLFGGASSYITTVSVNTPGCYVYAWHEISGACDSTDNVTICFVQQPIADAGDKDEICGLDYTLQATQSVSGSTCGWSTVAPMNATITPSTSPNANAHANTGYGTYFFVWTETNGICVSRDTVRIDFLQIPIVNAGIDTTACGQTATLVADSLYPGYWTSSESTIFTPDATYPTVNVWIQQYTQASHNVTFTWHAFNGTCAGSDAVNITFIKVPHPEAGPPQSICGTVGQLNADTIGSGIVDAYWTSNTPGVLISGGDPIPWNANIDATSLGSGFWVNSQHPVYFYWHAQFGNSCGSVDSTLVTFYQIPDADAGLDTATCGLSYNLTGSWSIVNHSGLWSSLVGNPGSANFTPSTNDAALVTVTNFGVYQFIWNEMNLGNLTCSDRDTITINFKIVPMPDAGLDFGVCGKFAYICADTTVSDGSWSCPIGGVAYYDAPIDLPIHNVPSYKDSACTWIRYGSENDTITMYWSEFNGVCYGYDSVNVYFGSIQTALQNVNPTDTFVCGPTFYHLNAQQPAYGTGYWIDTVPMTQFSPSATITNPTATIDTGGISYYGWHHFYWITNNGGCRDTSTVVPVLFIEKPVANAGINYWPGLFGANHEIKTDTACGLSWQMGAIPSVGTGTWYSGTGVHFGTITGPPTSSIYNDSVYLSAIGGYTVFGTPKYREFIWQENNNGCYDSDTIRLYFAPVPSGMFTVTMPQCLHDSSMIIANTWNLPNNIDYGITTFTWQYPNGVLDSSITTPNNSDTIFVSWPTGTQHNVTLITTNEWLCESGIVTHNVVEPAPFAPNYNLIEASCGNCNGEVNLYTYYIKPPLNDTITNYYTFNWVDSIFNNSSSLTQTGLCPLVNYNVVVNGQSLSPNANPGSYCHDSILIHMPDTGYVTAQFDTLTLEQNQAAPYDVQFINTSIGGRKYSWRIYDEAGELLYTSTLESPNYIFEDEGCYQIVLVATSKWQCKDTTMFNPLCVDAYPVLEVPNAFTPNGDGQNDYFRVHSKSILEFHAVILNRWGKKLYEWDDANGYWDGKIGGSEAAPGIYYYVVTAKGKKETDFEFKGFFYLLREK